MLQPPLSAYERSSDRSISVFAFVFLVFFSILLLRRCSRSGALLNQLSRAECRPKSRRITEFLNKQEQKRQRERETDRKRERERERLWKRLTGADPHDLINRTFAHHHRGFLVHFFSFFLDFFFCAFGKNNWPAYRGLGGEPRHSKRKTASFLSLSLSLSLSLWSVKRRTVVEVCRKICLLTTCFGGRSLSPPPVYQLSNRLVFDAYQANGIVNVSKQHLPFGRLSRWFNVIYGARWSPPAARYRRRPLEECEFLFFFFGRRWNVIFVSFRLSASAFCFVQEFRAADKEQWKRNNKSVPIRQPLQEALQKRSRTKTPKKKTIMERTEWYTFALLRYWLGEEDGESEPRSMPGIRLLGKKKKFQKKCASSSKNCR